jgi:hypothetical protein
MMQLNFDWRHIEMEDEIKISLTKHEAVILLEFVTRLNKSKSIQDKPEQRALWNLESVLEKGIPEIFSENYGEILEEARKSLQD